MNDGNRALGRHGRTVLALSAARMADALGNSILTIILPLYVEEVAAGAPWAPGSSTASSPRRSPPKHPPV